MATYALGLVPLIEALVRLEIKAKMVAFADDITGADTIKDLHRWWMKLLEIGPKFGYYPKPSKSYLIVKEEHLEEARNLFEGTSIKITSSGKRHLGAVIGSQAYKEEYVNNIVDK